MAYGFDDNKNKVNIYRIGHRDGVFAIAPLTNQDYKGTLSAHESADIPVHLWPLESVSDLMGIRYCYSKTSGVDIVGVDLRSDDIKVRVRNNTDATVTIPYNDIALGVFYYTRR